MAARAFLQSAEHARRRITAPLPLLGVAGVLFDRAKNPRVYPRIFYIGSIATPVVAQLVKWREGPVLTYAAVMPNATVHIGKHWVKPIPPHAPVRPDCRAHTGPWCAEYVITPLGICASHDTSASGPYDPRSWDEREMHNQIGVESFTRQLLDTNHMTDFFSANAARVERAATDFAAHMPEVMQNAIADIQAAGQRPAA